MSYTHTFEIANPKHEVEIEKKILDMDTHTRSSMRYTLRPN